MDIVDIEYAVTKASHKDPIIHLKRGKDYGVDRTGRKITINKTGRVHNGMVVSAECSVVPEYIIESVPINNRQQLTDVDDSKAELLNLPKHCSAMRADLFFDSGAEYCKD